MLTSALSILGLGFKGFDLLAKIKAAIAWASISLLIGLGGYVYGRVDASQAARVAALESTIAALEHEKAAADDLRRLAEKQVADHMQDEANNGTFLPEIDKVIDASPLVRDVVPRRFLDGLRKLR